MKRYAFRSVAAITAAILGISCSDSTGPDTDPLSITTHDLPAAVVGEAYAEGIDAEGGDGAYEWEVVAGRLPSGLVFTVEGLTDDDALVQGAPESTDSATFTVEVRSGDGQVATQELTIRVIPDPIENVALAPALVGYPYDVALRSSSALAPDARWELAEGTLPAGLSLEGARIAGTPTTPDTARFTLRLVSSSVTVTRSFEIRVVAERTAGYQITPFEVVDVPPGIRPHLDAAIAQWERVLTADLPVGSIPAGTFGAEVCAGFGEELNGTAVDDMLLLVNIESIDGVGKVLGQAGPCLFREDTLPAVGILTLDLDDLEPLIGRETLTFIISHEIGHVLGFGALWDSFGLVEGADTNDPRFTGAAAVAEWQALGGEGMVPLEDGGGERTKLSHWREGVFDAERMTGYSEAVGMDQPLSRVSVASMSDLGYSVDLSAADSYFLGSALRAHDEDTSALWGNLGWDVLYRGPVGMLDRRGRGRTIELR